MLGRSTQNSGGERNLIIVVCVTLLRCAANWESIHTFHISFEVENM